MNLFTKHTCIKPSWYTLYLIIFFINYASIKLIGKDPDAGRDWGQEEKGMTEDEMAGYHRLDGHEFE